MQPFNRITMLTLLVSFQVRHCGWKSVKSCIFLEKQGLCSEQLCNLLVNICSNLYLLFDQKLYVTRKKKERLPWGRYLKQFRLHYLKHRAVKMLVIVLLAILPFSLGDRCQHPPPAANYQNSLYQGRWYEIGKVINQTNFFSTQFQNHDGESNFLFTAEFFI